MGARLKSPNPREISMRLILTCAAFFMPAAALAANDLPEGVEQLLTCGHVYAMRSDDAKEAGDEDAALEFYYMGDALIWEARTSLEVAGYSPEQIENID